MACIAGMVSLCLNITSQTANSCGISGTEHTIISFMSEFIKLRDNYSVFAGDFHFNCQLSVVLQLHKISLCV